VPVTKKTPVAKKAPAKKTPAATTAAPAKKTPAEKAVLEAKVAKETPAEARARRKREKEEAERPERLFYELTKVIVPAYFGNDDAMTSMKKAKELPPEALLCLTYVGSRKAEGGCEVGVQMSLRPSGFDRQEARDVAQRGFDKLKKHEMISVIKTNENFDREPQLRNYKLTEKALEVFNLLERSALTPYRG
jgi:hypothetical protein